MPKLKLASAALLFLACTQAAHAVDWVERAEAAAQAAGQSRGEADRTVALVRTAVTKARNASGINDSSGSNGSPSATRLAQSAAEAISAYAVLEQLFPDQQLELEIKLAVALADIPESQAKADALVLGRAVANEILLALPKP